MNPLRGAVTVQGCLWGLLFRCHFHSRTHTAVRRGMKKAYCLGGRDGKLRSKVSLELRVVGLRTIRVVRMKHYDRMVRHVRCALDWASSSWQAMTADVSVVERTAAAAAGVDVVSMEGFAEWRRFRWETWPCATRRAKHWAVTGCQQRGKAGRTGEAPHAGPPKT